MTKLRKAIQSYARARQAVTCELAAKAAEPALGYRPSLPSVSRTLRELGWDKVTVCGGKVGFMRTERSDDGEAGQ